MELAPLNVACPQCGSTDVVYSCQPTCCFNHICNRCYTTFELETTQVGEVKEAFAMPAEPDASAPTAPCARCGEPKVFAIRPPAAGPASTPQHLCVACKALLTLRFTAVAPG